MVRLTSLISLAAAAMISNAWAFGSRAPERTQTSSDDEKITLITNWIPSSEGPDFVARIADQCSNLSADLSAIPKKPRDQGRLGLCFAYAASDVISQALGEPVSAADLAFSYFRSQGKDSIEALARTGGSIENVAMAASPNGLCLESALPSDTAAPARIYLSKLVLSDPDAKVYVDAGYGWQLLPDTLSGFDGALKRLAEAKKSALAGDSDALAKAGQDLAYVFPSLSAATISQTISNGRNQTDFALASDIVEQSCAGHRKMFSKSMASEADYVTTGGKIVKAGFRLFPELDQALASGRMAAIAFDVGQVMNATDVDKMKSLGFSGDDLTHAATIIGRRFHAGRCEYLVRNSWGDRCDMYIPEIKTECDQGVFWIPENTLSSSLEGIYFINR